MRCTKCGTESTTSRKFCAACGSPLSRRCPKCGAENAPSSAFCEDCGAALTGNAASAATGSPQAASMVPEIRVTPEEQDPLTTIDGERKTVTALFADIKDSTEMMRDLDPEDARAIIDPALKLMIDAIHRYDGYVVQSTGDGIFALFGAPVAHEDHPQRALLCGAAVAGGTGGAWVAACGAWHASPASACRHQHWRTGSAHDPHRWAHRVHPSWSCGEPRGADAVGRPGGRHRDQ